jgi:argininosuccinate lyase
MTAHLLGFISVLKNSLYAANTRGEIEIKILSDFSLLALHIKRTMQEIILWSTYEFGFMEIDDLYTTGGTAQPNLQNPDTLEIVRANSSKIFSNLFEMMSAMSFLTSGYNRDTQLTKSAIIESMDIIQTTLPVVTGIMTSLKLNKKRMEELANINFSSAPDLSNQIAVKGNISFREAYQVIKFIIKNKLISRSLSEITPEMIKKIASQLLNKEVIVSQQDIDMLASAKQRVMSIKSSGGPQPSEIKNMIIDIINQSKKLHKKVDKENAYINKAIQKLEKEVKLLINK